MARARPGRKVADGRVNYQNQFFDSLSEIISLLEYEYARPGIFDLLRWAGDSKCPSAVKKFTLQIRHLIILIFLWVFDTCLQLYFCGYAFPSETISVSIYFS
jgi:hypothetical protein